MNDEKFRMEREAAEKRIKDKKEKALQRLDELEKKALDGGLSPEQAKEYECLKEKIRRIYEREKEETELRRSQIQKK